ncbi:hypothetical protein JOD43_002138 [Pullulanibacillus pueri]|nr:hypothetical protein [Pullulanibacillus pueri]
MLKISKALNNCDSCEKRRYNGSRNPDTVCGGCANYKELRSLAIQLEHGKGNRRRRK